MFNDLKDVYRYRALVWALVKRHLALRYRGSVFGFLWSFLNPLCLMLIYMLVFKYYIRFDQVDNYTIFLFCGLLPWLWFSSGVIEGTSAIVSSGHLITKSMFPPQILPTVAALTSMIHFLFSLPLLFIFIIFAGLPIQTTLVFLPFVVLIQLLFVYGLGLLLGSLNVQFRDVQHVVANLLTFLFFLCPILYPVSVVPEKLQFTLEWNPLAVLTTMYHSVILDGVLPAWSSVAYVFGWTAIVVLLGHVVFERYRESFAELL